jgi:hypothetical protein
MGRKGTRSKNGRKRKGGSRMVRTLAKAIVPFGLLMTQKRLHKKSRRGRGKSRRGRGKSRRGRK